MKIVEDAIKILAIPLFFGIGLLFLMSDKEIAADNVPKSYIPKIIEMPQEHAWCYVLVNSNHAIGNIHILSCVPKE